jgi:hypothetical protein
MPMVRCLRCAVIQYAATPHVAPVECVVCAMVLVDPRPALPAERERVGSDSAARS